MVIAISEKGLIRAGKVQEYRMLPLLALPLLMKLLGKGLTKAARRYNNLDHMDKNL